MNVSLSHWGIHEPHDGLCHKCRPIRGRPRIAEIIAKTAEKHGLKVSDLTGPRRFRPIVRARWEAMAEAYDLRIWQSTVIGRAFNRDHSTVLHAVQQVRARG